LLTSYHRSALQPFAKISLVFVLTCCCLISHGQKTDKVHLKNGDVLTGEIMSMKFAMLVFKMDGPGTINIKWEEVNQIKSDKIFEFTMRWGSLIVCPLDTLFIDYHVRFLDDIIEIIPIKDIFLKRLNGDANLGFNYTKSNSILQFNFTGNIAYIVPKLEINLKLNSVLTNYGKDTSLTKKQDIIGTVIRNISKRFYLGSSIGWQENTELGLASRYLISGVVGLESLTDNHNRLTFGAGLSFNKEQSIESNQFKSNFDGLLNITYKRFYYSAPKLSITADYLIYPGISDWGRIRMQADLNLSAEVLKDLLVGLVFYYSYDNRPPQGSLANYDFGILFTIGYSFGK
jgi:Protein of unknown function, DUF481